MSPLTYDLASSGKTGLRPKRAQDVEGVHSAQYHSARRVEQFVAEGVELVRIHVQLALGFGRRFSTDKRDDSQGVRCALELGEVDDRLLEVKRGAQEVHVLAWEPALPFGVSVTKMFDDADLRGEVKRRPPLLARSALLPASQHDERTAMIKDEIIDRRGADVIHVHDSENEHGPAVGIFLARLGRDCRLAPLLKPAKNSRLNRWVKGWVNPKPNPLTLTLTPNPRTRCIAQTRKQLCPPHKTGASRCPNWMRGSKPKPSEWTKPLIQQSRRCLPVLRKYESRSKPQILTGASAVSRMAMARASSAILTYSMSGIDWRFTNSL